MPLNTVPFRMVHPRAGNFVQNISFNQFLEIKNFLRDGYMTRVSFRMRLMRVEDTQFSYKVRTGRPQHQKLTLNQRSYIQLRLNEAYTMIVVENVQADAESIITVVASRSKRVPQFYPILLSISCVVSLLCFSLSLADNIATNVAQNAIPAILAYAFFLPYQGAGLLLFWLEEHQTDSIFSFTPSSIPAIAYTIFLSVLWTICFGFAIWDFRIGQPFGFVEITQGTVTLAIISIVMSLVQLLLLIGITWLCWRHRYYSASQSQRFDSQRYPSSSSEPKTATA